MNVKVHNLFKFLQLGGASLAVSDCVRINDSGASNFVKRRQCLNSKDKCRWTENNECVDKKGIISPPISGRKRPSPSKTDEFKNSGKQKLSPEDDRKVSPEDDRKLSPNTDKKVQKYKVPNLTKKLPPKKLSFDDQSPSVSLFEKAESKWYETEFRKIFTSYNASDNIFNIFSNFSKNEKILIIDFENLKRALVGPTLLSTEIEKRQDFKRKLQNLPDPPFTENYKNRITRFTFDEKQHISTWLFIIKNYLNNNIPALNYDKIIIVCKQVTWDEWFDYAFSKFPESQVLKNKCYIVHLKIKPKNINQCNKYSNLRKKSRFDNCTYGKALLGLDDYILYFIRMYLIIIKNISKIDIFTLDDNVYNDFMVYTRVIDYFRKTPVTKNSFNPFTQFKVDITLSRGQLAFYSHHNPPNVYEYKFSFDTKNLIFNPKFLKLFNRKNFPQIEEDWLNSNFRNYQPYPTINNYEYDRVYSSFNEYVSMIEKDNKKIEDMKKIYKSFLQTNGGTITRNNYEIENIN